MSSRATVFDHIDLGTTVTTATIDEFYVTVDPEVMMYDYGIALLHELNRRNPLKYSEAVKILLSQSSFSTIEEVVHHYMMSLATIRIESINGNCPVWRQVKKVSMTAVIQDALSCLGVITDRAHGFRIIPKMKKPESYDIKELLYFSDFLDGFQDEGLKTFSDAMPRSEEGDVDTMSCVIVSEEIKSFKVDAHPTFSYIAAFLGLEPDSSKAALRYDVRYDNIHYIKFELLKEVRKCTF